MWLNETFSSWIFLHKIWQENLHKIWHSTCIKFGKRRPPNVLPVPKISFILQWCRSPQSIVLEICTYRQTAMTWWTKKMKESNGIVQKYLDAATRFTRLWKILRPTLDNVIKKHCKIQTYPSNIYRLPVYVLFPLVALYTFSPSPRRNINHTYEYVSIFLFGEEKPQ